MGKHSQKSVTDAEPQREPERSGQCSDRDNPEQGSLAPDGASEETGQGVDGISYEEMKDFYEAYIVVLEKQLEHYKEIAKR